MSQPNTDEQPGLEHAKTEGSYPEAVKHSTQPYQPDSHAYYGNYEPLPGHQRQKRTICGLAVVTFFLCLALAIVAILGVVGTGISASLAVKRQHEIDRLHREVNPTITSPTSSSTPTAVNQTSLANNGTCPPAPGPNVVLPFDCQSVQPQNNWVSDQPSLGGTRFDIVCDFDYPGNDITGIFVDTLENCMLACASFNRRAPSEHANLTCGAVKFGGVNPNAEGNCWLKTGPGDARKGTNIGSAIVQ